MISLVAIKEIKAIRIKFMFNCDKKGQTYSRSSREDYGLHNHFHHKLRLHHLLDKSNPWLRGGKMGLLDSHGNQPLCRVFQWPLALHLP